jgi:hypothetical protein
MAEEHEKAIRAENAIRAAAEIVRLVRRGQFASTGDGEVEVLIRRTFEGLGAVITDEQIAETWQRVGRRH